MNMIFKYSMLIIFFMYSLNGYTQTLDINKTLKVKLSDSSEVQLYRKVNSFDDVSQEYYYLPSHLRFSTTKLKEPEFSLLMYNSDENTGAILHFLMTWGLTKQQLEDVDLNLKKTVGEEARLMGAVTPEIIKEKDKIQISGDSQLVNILNNSVTNIGKVITFPNSKVAASFKLSKEDSQLLNKAIQENSKSLKETIFTMNFIISFKENGKYSITKKSYELKQNLYKLLNKPL